MDDNKTKTFLDEAQTRYPMFVRPEMTLEEFFEELDYYMYNVFYLRKGMNEYKSLYEQRKKDPNVVSNVPK